MAQLSVFDRTLQLTEEWVNQVAKELGIEDKHKAFQGLRAMLHVLRDRISAGEAAHLGAELPILLAGFYYEGWKPEHPPNKLRSKQEFLTALQEQLHHYFPKGEPDFDVEQLARVVLRVMSDRIPTGEISEICGIVSAEIKDLFPEAVRA